MTEANNQALISQSTSPMANKKQMENQSKQV